MFHGSSESCVCKQPIATNIPQRLKTAFVLQGHNCFVTLISLPLTLLHCAVTSAEITDPVCPCTSGWCFDVSQTPVLSALIICLSLNVWSNVIRGCSCSRPYKGCLFTSSLHRQGCGHRCVSASFSEQSKG